MEKHLFFTDKEGAIKRAYTNEQIGDTPIMTFAELKENPQPDTEYIFSTWGMPAMTDAEIAMYFPRLKAVMYGAGSVQNFARPFLARGIRVFSAWAANAVPVAEFAAAQIVLANKGYFQMHSRYQKDFRLARAYSDSFFEGNFGGNVGLLGAGMIGRLVISLLKSYKLNIYVFDPFMSEEKAKELGVIKADLTTIFSTCRTISNHLANNAQTRGMLTYDFFSLMLPNATFINTGRGSQLVAADLLRAMHECPERTALLDVCDPEEPAGPDSEYWKHPNVFMSPHCAGSMQNEVRRMGAYMIAEYERIQKGEPVLYEVTEAMLATMA